MKLFRQDHTTALEKVPDVDIDPAGIFKYILIRLDNGEGQSKYIVRGYSSEEYHGETHSCSCNMKKH